MLLFKFSLLFFPLYLSPSIKGILVTMFYIFSSCTCFSLQTLWYNCMVSTRREFSKRVEASHSIRPALFESTISSNNSFYNKVIIQYLSQTHAPVLTTSEYKSNSPRVFAVTCSHKHSKKNLLFSIINIITVMFYDILHFVSFIL